MDISKKTSLSNCEHVLPVLETIVETPRSDIWNIGILDIQATPLKMSRLVSLFWGEYNILFHFSISCTPNMERGIRIQK